MKLTRPANKDFSNPFAPGPKPVRHSGLDFGHGSGTEVRAAAPGRVVSVHGGGGTNGGWGNRVIIEHAPGVFTAYAHLRTGSIGVKVGDTVSDGQLIAQMGNTGTKDVHLHFELMFGGAGPSNRVDPAPFFSRDLPGTGAPAGVGRASRTVKNPVGAGYLNGRLSPQVDDRDIPQTLPAGVTGEFDGFIRGQRVTVQGTTSDIWFRGAYRGNYFAAAGFTSQDTTGMADLASIEIAPAPSSTHQYFTAPRGGQYHFPSEADALVARGYSKSRMVPAGVKRHVVKNPGRGPVEISFNGATVWVGTRNHPAHVTVGTWDPGAA